MLESTSLNCVERNHRVLHMDNFILFDRDKAKHICYVLDIFIFRSELFCKQIYFHSFNYFSSLKCVTNKLLTNEYQLPQCFCIAWFGADYPTLIDCKLLNLASPPFLYPNPYNLALSGSWSQALKLLLFSYTTVPKFHSVLIRATSGVELHPCGSLRTLIL